MRPARLREGRGAVDPLPAPVLYMGIQPRRLYIPIPEQFRNGPNVVAVSRQVREGMRAVTSGSAWA
jgi:hypothetical protein